MPLLRPQWLHSDTQLRACDSRDVSLGSLTKRHGLYKNNRYAPVNPQSKSNLQHISVSHTDVHSSKTVRKA
jgi:hypothetical protein